MIEPTIGCSNCKTEIRQFSQAYRNLSSRGEATDENDNRQLWVSVGDWIE